MTARTVCGCDHRSSAEIVHDFTNAAQSLSAMAGDWSQGQFKPSDLANADAILRGLQHLLVELRSLAETDK